MTEPGLRVREALARVADDAPSAVGLASAARRRARTRRRSRWTVASAVAVAAVVVPVALLAGGDPAGRGPVAPDPGTSPTAGPAAGQQVPDGWRVVSWKDLSVAVPGDWEEGARTAWCANGGTPDVPVVQGNGTPIRDIKCHDPEYSLGISVSSEVVPDLVFPSGTVWQYHRGDEWDGSQTYVDGSWLGHVYQQGWLVRVNAADRMTVERILATVQVGEWHEVQHDGVSVEVPSDWVELDTSECEFAFPKLGPPERDPCGDGAGLAFYDSSTFDPAYRPDDLHRDEPSGTWGGYTYAGDYAVWVTDESRWVVERVLASAR